MLRGWHVGLGRGGRHAHAYGAGRPPQRWMHIGADIAGPVLSVGRCRTSAMTPTLTHDRMLELIADRSALLRSSVAGALDAPVPGCPEWTGRDLVAHLGEVHRFWAAVVAVGSPDKPPEDDDVPEREPTGDLLDWSERSAETLLAALRDAGPDRAVWTWWGEPALSGAVARHQVQEATVHAWDAEDTVGRAGALPEAVAVDGIDEFLTVNLPFAGGWPHPAATVGIAADEVPGRGCQVVLRPQGGRLERGDARGDAVVRGSASDIVLAFYGRRGLDALSVAGDRKLAERFFGWFTTE